METTIHAQVRARQRGIPETLLRIVEECGNVSHAPGGAQKLFFGKREAQLLRQELKRMLQAIDKAQGKVLIVKDGLILTTYCQ
jgi:DNA invertase Pin-like site-specific DNA recombinase